MTESVVLKVESPADIASEGLSNLVVLWRAPDVDEAYHKFTTSSKSPSRSQRCFPRSDRNSPTRLDGFQVKYQPCSQMICEVAELVDAPRIAEAFAGVAFQPKDRVQIPEVLHVAGSSPVLATNWQKSRRDRPLINDSGPNRDCREGNVMITRSYDGYREGKSGNYAQEDLT